MNSLDKVKIQDRKGDVLGLKRSCDVLTRCGVVPEDFPLVAELQKIIKANGFDKKK